MVTSQQVIFPTRSAREKICDQSRCAPGPTAPTPMLLFAHDEDPDRANLWNMLSLVLGPQIQTPNVNYFDKR